MALLWSPDLRLPTVRKSHGSQGTPVLSDGPFDGRPAQRNGFKPGADWHNAEKLVFPRLKRENKSREGTKHNEEETIVNRTLAVLGIATLGTSMAVAGAGLAQTTSKSTK